MVEFTHGGYLDRGGRGYREGEASLMYNYGSGGGSSNGVKTSGGGHSKLGNNGGGHGKSDQADPLVVTVTKVRVNTDSATEATVAD